MDGLLFYALLVGLIVLAPLIKDLLNWAFGDGTVEGFLSIALLGLTVWLLTVYFDESTLGISTWWKIALLIAAVALCIFITVIRDRRKRKQELAKAWDRREVQDALLTRLAETAAHRPLTKEEKLLVKFLMWKRESRSRRGA